MKNLEIATLYSNVLKSIKYGDKEDAKTAFEKYTDNLPDYDSIAADRDRLKQENAELVEAVRVYWQECEAVGCPSIGIHEKAREILTRYTTPTNTDHIETDKEPLISEIIINTTSSQ